MTPGQQPFDNDSSDGVDLRAAEYVLGLLDANARREAQARIEREPAFAAEVAVWEQYFTPWLEAIAPVQVPAALWPRIRAILWQHELPVRGAQQPKDARVDAPLLQSLAFWRGMAAAGFAVAAAAVVLMLGTQTLTPQPTAPTPVATAPVPAPTAPAPVVPVAPAPAIAMVVALKHEDGSTAYTAMLDPDNGTVVLVPVNLRGDPSLAPELWLIPPGQSPQSLGMIDRDKAMVVTVPTALRRTASSDGTFAISLEPAGSGPHQAPTGPVVATGTSIRLAP